MYITYTSTINMLSIIYHVYIRRKHAMSLMESNSMALIPLLVFGVHTQGDYKTVLTKTPTGSESNSIKNV
ncbi:hypothetical protein Scep_028082 [Stephania cephalantha]|uniref:Uncharacterized protein n=1 Tax=Stephania cephalantha TaxID=152367 RepID=A0AAP0EBG0_9MAGN